MKKRAELDYKKYLEFRWACERLSYEGSYFEELVDPSGQEKEISFLGIRDHQRVYAAYNAKGERDSEPAEIVEQGIPVFTTL